MKTAIIASALLLSSCGDALDYARASDPVNMSGAWDFNKEYASIPSEIQFQIDALPDGGEIKLPCGRYESGVLVLHSNINLIGSGVCTVIGSVTTKPGRDYFINISNLSIDGNIDGYNGIGIDFTDCSICYASKVFIRNVQFGALLYGQSYYNVLSDLTINPNKHCYEIGGVANENIIRGGRCIRSNIGVWVSSANNIRIMNSSFETMDTAFLLGSGALHTMIFQPRCEAVDICVDATNAKDTTLISPYTSNTRVRLKGRVEKDI